MSGVSFTTVIGVLFASPIQKGNPRLASFSPPSPHPLRFPHGGAAEGAAQTSRESEGFEERDAETVKRERKLSEV